jgi:hypothetical protein
MTLIVSAVAGNWAMHASDRYVGVKATPKGAPVEHDPHSNKTVVVCARDYWVVLGYTGLAYLDGKPTDQLIAEAISGYDDLSGAMGTFWQPPPGLHYREIRNRVEQKLKDAYSRLPKSVADQYSTLVLGAGVQRKDGMVTKVMYRTHVEGGLATSIEIGPATPGFKAFFIDAVGMVNKPIIDRAKDRLTAIADPVDEIPDIVRDILKDAVLETSSITPFVGNDIMTVVLDNPKQTVRTALHIADPQRQAELFKEVVDAHNPVSQTTSTVSTPWVLMPGMIFGPSIGNPGGWSVNNGISFEFSGFGDPPSSGGGGAFFGVQPRKPKP